ncbi:MAG: hypothetical protein U0625_00085 [Phycisphaerales bacterium]
MQFFADENFPVRLVRILDHFDADSSFEHLIDAMERGTRDVEWIQTLANRSPRPAVITGDGRILRNAAELQVLRANPLTMFVLASGWVHLPWEEYVLKFLKVWPRIRESAGAREPCVFEVPSRTSPTSRSPMTQERSRLTWPDPQRPRSRADKPS